MFPFEFTRPTLLILIVPIGMVLGIWFVRSLSDFPRRQRIVSLVTRSIIASLLVFSLAGLTWLHRTHEQFVLFVVDQSLSLGGNAEDAATEFLKRAAENRGSHRVAYLPFASTPGTVQYEPPEFGLRLSLTSTSEKAASGIASESPSADEPTGPDKVSIRESARRVA